MLIRLLPLGRDAKNGDDACVDFIMERASTYIQRTADNNNNTKDFSEEHCL
jgi:hypothetical protein